MPTYCYSCSNPECVCQTYEVYESIKADAMTICPYCSGASVHRVPQQISSVINKTPKTLGSQMDLNTKRMGKYKMQEEIRKMQEERLTKNEFVGTLPEGASIVKREAKDTWWRKGTEKIDMSLANLTPSQTEKYVMTGRKPIK